jgi:HKD family nuclease
MNPRNSSRRADHVIELVSNSGGSHLAVLLELLASADRIVICTAFLKSSGEKLLEKSLIAALRRGASIDIFAGSNFYQTEPAALERLLAIFQTEPSKARLYLTDLQGQSTFHPKLYWFTHGVKETLVVGSANLTSGGLQGNDELSLSVAVPAGGELSQSAQEFIAYARTRCIDGEPVSATQLAEYRRKHEIYKKHAKAAEKKTREEIKATNGISSTKLKLYLKRYLNDKSQQRNWKIRVENYKVALDVINRMADAKSMSRDQFMADYELLVGKKGGTKLWHSGSVFRSKNQVAKKHELFLAMLRKMRRQNGEKPAVMFEEAMAAAQQIPGLGVNVVTEMMSTFDQEKYAALNKNPIESLKELGYPLHSNLGKHAFSAEDYQQFVDVLHVLAKKNNFGSNLAQMDHFLNFIYWDITQRKKAKTQ